MSNSGMTETEDRRGRFSSQKIINYVNQTTNFVQKIYRDVVDTLEGRRKERFSR